MRRTDDVFFYVLVDFLIQGLFFGLLIYAVAQAQQAESKKARQKESAEIQRLKDATGVSNLTELTDELSKLGPVKELKGTADFISRLGGTDEVRRIFGIVSDAGGVESIVDRLGKLRRIEEGFGKPPCDPEFIGGRRSAKPLATVFADDQTIRFQASTAKLEEVLKLLDRNYDSVRQLQLAEFKRTFAPLDVRLPDCRHTLIFHEGTRFVDARDAARFTFNLRIVPAGKEQ